MNEGWVLRKAAFLWWRRAACDSKIDQLHVINKRIRPPSIANPIKVTHGVAAAVPKWQAASSLFK